MTIITTPFLEQARKQNINAFTSRRDRQPKAKTDAIEERREAFALWRHYRREQIDKLLAGPHGEAAHELIEFLKVLRFGQVDELIACANSWAHADADTRYLVLAMISAKITQLRETAKLPPFDDPLPGALQAPEGAPDNMFLKLRRILVSA